MAKIDPALLNDIYPARKTADELYTMRIERERLRDARRPSHPRRQITLIILGMLALIAAYMYYFKAIYLSSVLGFLITIILGLIMLWLLIISKNKIRNILDS